MRCTFIKTTLRNRIDEEYKRAALLAQVDGQGGRICNAIILAGKIEAYAAVN